MRFNNSFFGKPIVMSRNKILVVDDSQTIRIQLQRFLEDAGYEVVCAADGNEALMLVQQQRPALMILDVKMPELDGFGVCEKMQKLPIEFERLPIIFLTSLNSNVLQLLGHEMGAYLQKPVVKDQLLAHVKELLAPVCS